MFGFLKAEGQSEGPVMYSPKDLEGEVDHSFFDSDFEEPGGDGGVRRDEEEPPEARAPGRPGSAPGRESSSEEERGRSAGSPSGASSPLSCGAGSEPERAPGSRLTVPVLARIASVSSGEGEDEGGSSRSEGDSEEEGPEPAPPRCRSAHHGGPKKASGKFRTHSPSPSSSSSSESEGSSSESGGRAHGPPPRRRPPGLLTVSSPRRRAKLGVTSGKERLRLPEESEDTVTDVTPLSTPDISPVQSFDLALEKKGAGRQENLSLDLCGELGDLGSEQEGERSFPKTGRASLESDVGARHGHKVLNDAMDLNRLLKAFMSLERKMERSLVIDCPPGQPRRNFSFSSEEVRRIDGENQRLLRELSRQALKPRGRNGPTRKPASPPGKLYHSALNRQREQQRIERENMAFLKRLESVKPTVGMKRSEQLADYQRQTRYLGTGLSTRFDRSPSSRAASSGKPSRPCSASGARGTRPASTMSRSSRAAEPRTAWS
nr:PREDICTED: cilia- and flagella-associated protein 97 isoform X1 [Lepisosteus oculatus]XP_015201175.1 PREDICTED: cilia- and flagella-associated protein 97 isoform X1 [Lepisosteus oculatus]